MDKIAKTPILEVKTRAPVRVGLQAPLIEAVTLLREQRRGAVVVEDDSGLLAGIFTERDLITRVDHADHGWHARPVEQHMTRDPRTLDEAATVADAIRLMQAGTFRHLPVVAAERRVIAVVSIRDIIALIAEHFPRELLNLPPDPAREASRRWGG